MSLAEDMSRYGIGGNMPPLAERLIAETEELKERSTALAASASRAKVTDDDTAGKAVLLVGMIKDHRRALESRREAEVRPYLDGQRTVNAHFAGLVSITTFLDSKGKVIGGPEHDLLKMIDAHRREQERKAEEERRRLVEEARKQREIAEAAERERRVAEERRAREAEEANRRIREAEEAARRAGDQAAAEAVARERAEAAARAAEERAQAMLREMEATKAARDAAELEERAQAVKTAQVDSGYGVKAGGRTVTTGVITDFKKALAWAVKFDAAHVQAAVQQLVDRQVRAKNHNIPGVEIKTDTATYIR